MGHALLFVRCRFVVLVVVPALAACGHASGRGAVPPAPFTPRAVTTLAQPRLVFRSANAPGIGGLHEFEYVFPDRQIEVFELRRPFRLVARWRVPELHALRGVVANPRTRRLYFSIGGNGGSSGTGALLAYDVTRNHVLWERRFPTGTDSPAITPDGRTIYLPTGERSSDDVWYVVDAHSGTVRDEIHAGPGPHNTIVSPNGKRVYLGPRNSRYLYIASTASDRIVRRIGPLEPGVRPFTIDGSQSYVFTTATGVLGFQVSSIRSGRVLYTVRPRGFPGGRSLGSPSHGISITPDSREVDVIDVPNGYVHAYDVSRLPSSPPRLIANIRLRPDMHGREFPCGGDCGHAGWLQTSLDGRWLFAADDGDVIDLRRHRTAAFLPALRNSRYLLEIDWRGAKPLRTSTRSGIGYPRRARP